MQTRCPGGFPLCGYQKRLLPPVTFRIFGPKTAISAPKYASLGTYRPCQLIWFPVGWWLWCAGCISQDTYLLYCNQFLETYKKHLSQRVLSSGRNLSINKTHHVAYGKNNPGYRDESKLCLYGKCDILLWLCGRCPLIIRSRSDVSMCGRQGV